MLSLTFVRHYRANLPLQRSLDESFVMQYFLNDAYIWHNSCRSSFTYCYQAKKPIAFTWPVVEYHRSMLCQEKWKGMSVISLAVSEDLWTMQLNTSGVFLVEDILKAHAEAFACYSSTALTLYSVVARALVERGGPAIRAAAAKHSNARVGDVIVLPGGRLSSSYVLAAVTNTLHSAPTLATIRGCVGGLLSSAAALGTRSLAIPILRVKRQLPLEDIVRATVAPIFDYLAGSSNLRRVLIGVQSESDADCPRAMAHYLHSVGESLRTLGARRARIAGLQTMRQNLVALGEASPALHAELLRMELELQWQVRDLLEREQKQRPPDAASLDLELQHCVQLIERLAWELDHRAPLTP